MGLILVVHNIYYIFKVKFRDKLHGAKVNFIVGVKLQELLKAKSLLFPQVATTSTVPVLVLEVWSYARNMSH